MMPWSRHLRASRFLVVALTVLALPWVTPVHAQLELDDTVIVDPLAGTSSRGAVFRLDGLGAVSMINDLGNLTQGPLGADPWEVVIENADSLLVVDAEGTSGKGGVFRIEVSTAARTLLSDFADAGQGPLGVDPTGLHLMPDGAILVTDQSGGVGTTRGRLFSVDPVSGVRLLRSDFGVEAQGFVGGGLRGVVSSALGTVYVAARFYAVDNSSAPACSTGALFTVDIQTGARSVLSDFCDAGQGPLGGGTGSSPQGIALLPSGDILVAYTGNGANNAGTLMQVNRNSGQRTILTEFGSAAQGATGSGPMDVFVTAAGEILAVTADGGPSGIGRLLQIDPTTGARTLVKDLLALGNPISFAVAESATASPVVPKSCQPLLDSKRYRCSFKGECARCLFKGDEPLIETTACVQFASPPASVGSKFDMTVDWPVSGPVVLECMCLAAGTFKKPKFGAGKEFLCGAASVGHAATGLVNAKGTKITKGHYFFNYVPDTSNVFECVLDPVMCP
jgi:hypothetical protein